LTHVCCYKRLIPETKNRTLEEMDIIFGAVDADKRAADIEQSHQRIDHPSTYRGDSMEKGSEGERKEVV